MKLVSAIFLGLLVLGLAISASGLGRQPTTTELDRIERIRERNREMGYTWEAGVTSVSNLSEEEFQKLLGLRPPPDLEERRRMAREEGRMIEAIPGMYFPPSFDWRTQGGVTPVKNQGYCGSCWAFAAVAALESHVLIYSGMEEDLSEQAILSCNTAGDDCNGGWMSTAYDIFMGYGGVREECMPYHEVDTDPCVQTSCDVATTLDGYYYVDDTVDALKTAVLNGPVAVAMAACGGFSSYTGGCYEDNCTEINHGVLIIGWDDNMCSGQGAWIVKNSWGPDWGDNGYIYVKYGTCYIGYGADALDYTPGQTVHFFHDSHVIDDSAGDDDGFIETGEVINFPVTLLNVGAETATNVSGSLQSLTAGVDLVDSVATYDDIPKGETRQSDSPHFSFMLTPSGPSCGPIALRLVVTSDQGTSPINICLQAGEIVALFSDDFESDEGWTVGDVGDDAATGIWQRADPAGTWWGDQPVQPENDHTPSAGTQCYVTGASGGSQGTNDVDGGKTTLLSPTIDLSNKDSALLTYYRWYASETGSNPNDDDFIVDVSDDGGYDWYNLETRQCSDRNWRKMEFYLEDYIALTGQVRFRFIAQDNGVGGSIVEAAVDDFSILTCEEGPADVVPPAVTVVNPNGGEVCAYGSNYTLQWAASDNLGVTSVSILLSTDGGASYPDTIATGEANDGSYAWAVPDIDSRTARLKIVAYDAALNEGSDTSDADFTLWGTMSGVGPRDFVGVPGHVVLALSGGNPSAGSARVVFGIPRSSHVRLGIYDVNGRLVKELANGHRAEGYHSVGWDETGSNGSRLGPGIYFIRLGCRDGLKTTKVVIAN